MPLEVFHAAASGKTKESRREGTGTNKAHQERNENTMMRKRTQSGTIYRKGRTWYLKYNDDRVINGEVTRKRLARQLGSVDDMTKTKARQIADDFLTTINAAT